MFIQRENKIMSGGEEGLREREKLTSL